MNKCLLLILLFTVIFSGLHSQSQTTINQYLNKTDSLIASQKIALEQFEKRISTKIDETEQKLELNKNLVDFKNDSINKWLSILGIVLAIFGIGIPLIGLFYGKKLSDNLEKEQEKVSHDLKEFKKELKLELKEFITEAKEKIQRLESEASLCIANLKSKEARGTEIISHLESLASKAAQPLSDNEKIELAKQANNIKNNQQANAYQKDFADALSDYLSNNFTAAIQKFQELLATHPKDITVDKLSEIYFYLGYSHQSLKKIRESIDYFNKSLDLNPKLASTWNNLGNSYYKLADYEKCIDCYKKATEFKPNYHVAWSNLGSIYAQQKRHEEAVACFKKTLELKPRYINGHANFIEYLFISGNINEMGVQLVKAKELAERQSVTILFFEILHKVCKNEWPKNLDETTADLKTYAKENPPLPNWSFLHTRLALSDAALNLSPGQKTLLSALIDRIESGLHKN